MHQLIILFIGWAAFFHPVPDLVLTNIVSQSTFFAPDLWIYFFFYFCHFFLTLTFMLPSYLATLLTYILALHTNYHANPLPTYRLSFSISWQNLYLFLTKPLHLKKTIIYSYLNPYLLVKLLSFFG